MKNKPTSLLSKFRNGEISNYVYIASSLSISLLVIVSFILGYSIVSRLTETYLNLYDPPLLLGTYWALATGVTIIICNWFWRAWLSRLRHIDGKSSVMLTTLFLCHAFSTIAYIGITFEMTTTNADNLSESVIAIIKHFNGRFW